MAYDDEIINIIKRELDTHGKRYMFIKIFYPRLVSRVDLEGSPYQCANNIYSEFEKQGQLNNLKALLIKHFNNGL